MKLTFKQFLSEIESPISRFRTILKNRHNRHSVKEKNQLKSKKENDNLAKNNQNSTNQNETDVQDISN